MQTDPGKAYDATLSKHAERHYGPALIECVPPAPKPDLTSFQLLLNIASDGKVVRSLVKTATPIASCFRETVSKDTLPVPPKDGWWGGVDMKLSR